MNFQIEDLVALQLTRGAGPVRINSILELTRILNLSLDTLLGTEAGQLQKRLPAGSQELAPYLTACTDEMRTQARKLLGITQKQGIQTLPIYTEQYPAALRTCLGKGAPPLLFARGNLSLLKEAGVGIVGTRTPTTQGLHIARQCAQIFSFAGVPIISGGARGIDWAAHTNALNAGGTTIVILPQGMLTYEIPEILHTALQNGKALLLSEFIPNTRWMTHAAITRNGTISALTRLLCVIEPQKTGGSIQTARHSLEQRKPVYYRCTPENRMLFTTWPTAYPLLDLTGRLQTEAILNSWQRSTPASLHQQQELFDKPK